MIGVPLMGFNQDNSVLNCNSTSSNGYRAKNSMAQLDRFFPFPVDLGDIIIANPFVNLRLTNTNPTNSTPEEGPLPTPEINESQVLNTGPGLYAIVCSQKGKIYFGESDNVLSRVGLHYKDLVGEKHECKQLQEDFNTHSLSDFSFVSLSLGPQWKNTTTRRHAETTLIKLNLNKVYNQSIARVVPKKKQIFTKKWLATRVLSILVLQKPHVKLHYHQLTFDAYFVIQVIRNGKML